MSRKRIAITAIALASVAAASGLGTAAAQTASDTSHGRTGAQSPTPSDTGAPASDRPAGDFGPGGVPTRHETTTRQPPPPSTTGPSDQKPPGDFGPGGVPTQHETTTQPSHRSPAEGGQATGPDQNRSSQGH